MRAAPPVTATLGGGRLERMLITLLHALAGAVVAAWLTLHAEWSSGAAMAAAISASALAMAAVGHLLARRALPAAPGALRWDGQAWHQAGQPDGALQRVVVALDLGLWMLLRLHPASGGPAQWRVAQAHAAGPAWHGLRLALAAHAGAAPGGAPA